MRRSLPLLVAVTLAGCAGQPVIPPPPPAGPTGPDTTQPPPFEPMGAAGVANPRDPGSARNELRRSILDAAWRIVRDKHYDKTLGGLDWNAVRARHEPRAMAAPDEATYYRVLNEMLGELGQSHLEVTGPGAEPMGGGEELPPPPLATADPNASPIVNASGIGDPGVTVRMIDGRPTVSAVRPGSSGDRAGLLPGFIVTHIGGRALMPLPSSPRPLRPVEERFQLRVQAARRLTGPAGTRVTLKYLDWDDQPRDTILVRDPPRGKAVQVFLLPPLYPEVRVSQIGDVGVIAFNFFLLEPVLAEVQKAIDGFRARGARAVILDLRGNPGGVGAMAIPVAARLVNKPTVLGTIQFREYANTLTASPSLGVKPFTGKVVILTDEGTASTSEILAAGLQEAGRAIVVGDTTLGAVLPSAIEQLPGGAIMQYVVADFRTPKGVLLEGKGVQPNRRVLETRSALRTGRDPVLDAGLTAARASAGR